MQKYENYTDVEERAVMGVVSAQPMTVVSSETRPYEPPTGHWKDDWCNCLSNLWPSCCCVFLGGYSGMCMPMYLAAQISSRIGMSTTEKAMKIYIGIVCLFFLLGIIVGGASHNTGGTVFLFYFPYFFVFLFVMYLRYKFVDYYRINESGCETCCISCWCSPCSLCQMARHQWGYSQKFDGDAQLDGKQVYTTIPV